jgi:hypothetical protein
LEEEYLTVSELAVRLKLSPKTIKNKMVAGIFQKGTHYFSPAGIGPRFKWSVVQLWLEGSEPTNQSGIPMKRGYRLNASVSGFSKDDDLN